MALEPGEISEPVKTEFGWHVIRMVKKEVAVVRGREAAAARRQCVHRLQRLAAPTRSTGGAVDVNPKYGRFDEETLQVLAHLEHVDRHGHAVGPREPVRVSEGPAHVPEGPVPASQGGARLLDLIRVQARLRAPGGCPWDAEQTHRTLARHLLEETHELLEAIDADDSDAIRDELGDLLLQVTFHAQIAADDGRWDVDDVAQGLVEKLIHRHPHVFGDVEVSGSDEVLVNWERLKAEERRRAESRSRTTSPPRFPRSRARRRCSAGRPGGGSSGARRRARSPRSARRSTSWLPRSRPTTPTNAEEEIGDVLFSVVAVARKLGVDGESALRRTIRGFGERYERFAAVAAERGLDVDAMSEAEVRALFREVR